MAKCELCGEEFPAGHHRRKYCPPPKTCSRDAMMGKLRVSNGLRAERRRLKRVRSLATCPTCGQALPRKESALPGVGGQEQKTP